MKILITSNSCWNIYNYRLDLIKFLIKEGHELIIACPKDKFFKKINKLNCKFIFHKFNNKSLSILENFILVINYLRIFIEHKPNLSISYTLKPNIFSSLVSKILGVNHITNITGLGSFYLSGGIKRILYFLLFKYTNSKKNSFLFQNKYDYRLFLKKKIIGKHQGVVLPGSGVKIEKKKQINLNKIKNNSNFLFIGRFLADKGFNEFLRSAIYFNKSKKKINFLAIGEIDKNNPSAIDENLLRKVKLLKIVKFIKPINNKNKIFNSSSCIIVPSYREGISRTILEAGLRYKFVISSDVPGCKDLIKNNTTGLTFKKKNLKSLIQVIKTYRNLKVSKKKQIVKNLNKLVIQKYDQNIIFNLFKYKILKKYEKI